MRRPDRILRPAISSLCCLGLLAGLFLSGCGKKSSKKQPEKTGSTKTENKTVTMTGKSSSKDGQMKTSDWKPRKPIVRNSTKQKSGGNSGGPSFGKTAAADSGESMLKKLQVLVGEWRGVTQRAIAGAKGVEKPKWRWDFSDSKHPALAFDAKTSSFLKSGRLTYDPQTEEFTLAAVMKDDSKKTFAGQFAEGEEVRDVPAEDGKTVHRKFKITLKQTLPPPEKVEPLYQIELDQKGNNRYYLVVYRKASSTVRRIDTVANQREGTSFAAKLDDYGDKTCVVSQGLGTMAVSHNGKTYYVCCSGCKAAFEAEPDKWIAAYEEWKKKNKK